MQQAFADRLQLLPDPARPLVHPGRDLLGAGIRRGHHQHLAIGLHLDGQLARRARRVLHPIGYRLAAVMQAGHQALRAPARTICITCSTSACT
ncbi:hypothetical protein D3C86_2067730 [compost metagenome]